MAGSDVHKVVLAYSGGLDTSVIVPWLRDNYRCDVICFAADIGSATAVARYSPNSLYREDPATFGADDVYDQSDATGFIDLYGLQMKVRALMDEAPSTSPELAVQRD